MATFMRTSLSLLLPLLWTSLCFAQEEGKSKHLSSELRNKLKASTVYVHTNNDGAFGTGTGFVVKVDGDTVYMATNHHVINAERDGEVVKKERTRFRVTFDGDDRKTESVKAELLAADEDHDIAILKATRKNPPAPFELFSNQTMEETLPLTIFGYPMAKKGDGITVVNGTVSAFNHDTFGSMRRIKVFGKVDPGNSGGPMVDNEGAIIGVIVEKDRRADNVGYAIPAFELHELMRGRLGNFRMSQEGGPDEFELKVLADVMNPLGTLSEASLYYMVDDDLNPRKIKESVSDNGAKWRLLSHKMTRVAVALDGDTTEIKFQVKGEAGKKCVFQIVHKREGEPSWTTQPFMTILGGYFENPFDSESGKSDKFALPSKPEGSIAGKRVPLRGYRMNEWELGETSIVPNMMWDKDSLYLYVVNELGLVRKIDPFRNKVELQLDLQATVDWSVLSGEGLLVLTKDNRLWIVDDRTLMVRQVIESIPGARGIASARNSFYAFVATGGGKTLEVYDLVDAEKSQTYQATEFALPEGSPSGASPLKRFDLVTMSYDGRFLFCESDGALHRFRVGDDELTYDQAGVSISRSPERIQISEDSLYVSLVDKKGNREHPGSPIKPFGIYVYNVDDLSTPEMAADGGQPTGFLVREDASKSIFGTVKNAPLVQFDLEGTLVREFPELEGELASQILIYPLKPGFLVVLTDTKTYVMKQL
jgi:hypothetical protein